LHGAPASWLAGGHSLIYRTLAFIAAFR
jgi:hypothetical protein